MEAETFSKNVEKFVTIYKASRPRRQYTS